MGRAVQRWGTSANEFDHKDPGDNLSECCSKAAEKTGDMAGDGKSIGIRMWMPKRRDRDQGRTGAAGIYA
jgi:hypothetical protein